MANEAKTVLRYLETHYGKKAQEWEGQYQDDRQLFCNIYNRLINAYQEAAKKRIQSNLIWCALHDRRNQAEETLKDIMQFFERR